MRLGTVMRYIRHTARRCKRTLLILSAQVAPSRATPRVKSRSAIVAKPRRHQSGSAPHLMKQRTTHTSSRTLAERVGFEPTVPLRARQFSRLEPSTTRPPLRMRVAAATAGAVTGHGVWCVRVTDHGRAVKRGVAKQDCARHRQKRKMATAAPPMVTLPLRGSDDVSQPLFLALTGTGVEGLSAKRFGRRSRTCTVVPTPAICDRCWTCAFIMRKQPDDAA